MFQWVKKLICGSLKSIAIEEINAEGDKLQELLRARIAKEGVGAVDRTIDAAQLRIRQAIETRGPKWAFLAPVREKLSKAVQEFGDDLQAGIKKNVAEFGPAAVDRVFDLAQAALVKKIEAIAL